MDKYEPRFHVFQVRDSVSTDVSTEDSPLRKL
jgi:hypothetical protein